MPLAFRNLDITPDAPVSSWPTEAIQAALERGDLDDWRRIVAEVNRDPWGRTARQLEEVLSHSRPYGVADAMDVVLARARRHAEDREREQVAAEVGDAIARSGLSRSEFASRIGTSALPVVDLCDGEGHAVGDVDDQNASGCGSGRDRRPSLIRFGWP